ncbi:MAG: EamA family transporter [Janthinobacterium lividum]
MWGRRLPLPAGLSAPGAQMLCGGVFLLAASAVTHEHAPALLHLRTILAFAYLVVAAAIGYGAYAYLLRTVRPALATSNAYVNPVIAVALGAAFAGERLTALGGVALLLILSGVALTAFTKQTRK